MKMAAEKLRGTGIRCFVCPGNDDEMEVDEVVRRAELVELGEGRVVEIDGFTMISTGWSNPTPWNTHREDSEEKLAERIESMASQVAEPSRAIFNLHCPPFKSGLDEVPPIDADLKLLHGGRALRPVGSTAVRQAIEKHQPLLSLHGHIHESKGAIKIGKTLSINPGSAYEEGMLMGAIIQPGCVAEKQRRARCPHRRVSHRASSLPSSSVDELIALHAFLGVELDDRAHEHPLLIGASWVDGQVSCRS